MSVIFRYPGTNPNITSREADYYLNQAMSISHCSDKAELREVTVCDNDNNDKSVSIEVSTCVPKFERIRRITGYLTGTVDRWNNAKRAELNDRVKHA